MGLERGLTATRVATAVAGVLALAMIAAPSALARPTDKTPAGEPSYGKVKEQKPLCRKAAGGALCVHWVADGDHKASRAQVSRTMKAFQSAWQTAVGKLGYRAPLPDRSGGKGKLKGAIDVYLANIGVDGATEGQCKPTAPKRAKHPRAAKSAYCIVENDFKGLPPGESIGPVAAHEFFHAVQYAYNSLMPGWLAEGTAVWMQSQVLDTKQGDGFLLQSPLTDPQLPLDTSDQLGAYGTWIFWQYVSEAVGTGPIRSVFESSAAGPPTGPGALALMASAASSSAEGLLNGFAAWNYELGAPWSYRRGGEFAAVVGARTPADASYVLLPSHPQTDSRGLAVGSLASAYVTFRNATSSTCTITVATSDPSNSGLIAEQPDGAAPTQLAADPSGTTGVSVGPGGTVVLVLSNPTPGSMTFTYQGATSCT